MIYTSGEWNKNIPILFLSKYSVTIFVLEGIIIYGSIITHIVVITLIINVSWVINSLIKWPNTTRNIKINLMFFDFH